MRKPSAINKQDDTLNPFAKHAKSYRHIEEEASPDSYDNSNTSDTDSVSVESRKIRKKRNTYHKISDDIRVMLLEAVQNGETLKAAAKRHNINYSSAKSILHTYRKEGRILKKSVQERSFKKRAEPSETETEQTPKKQKKALKKETTPQLPVVTRHFEEPSDEPTEEVTPQQQQGNVRKSERIRINQITHSGAKVDNQENAVVKTGTQGQVEQPAMAMVSGTVPPQQVQYGEQHYYNNAAVNQHNHHNDHKMFDNFFNSYSTEASYRNTMPIAYEGQDDHYHMDYHHNNNNHHHQYPKEFDSFNDMMDTLHHRPMRNYGYQDANAFLCSREVNTAHLFDERGHKGGNDGHCNNYDTGMNSVFKGFLDTQNMFRDTLGESPFGNNENNFRCRKDSIDFS